MMNHFDYSAPGGTLNNHSTGFSDSWPDTLFILEPKKKFMWHAVLVASNTSQL